MHTDFALMYTDVIKIFLLYASIARNLHFLLVTPLGVVGSANKDL